MISANYPEHYRSKSTEQALAHLCEELNEAATAVAKSIRFGLPSVNPELPEAERESNLVWMCREMADVAWAYAVVELFCREAGWTFDNEMTDAFREAARLAAEVAAEELHPSELLRWQDELDRRGIDWREVEAALKAAEMAIHPLAEIRELDAVVHALGIEDSHTTPAEAVGTLQVELQRVTLLASSRSAPSQEG